MPLEQLPDQDDECSIRGVRAAVKIGAACRLFASQEVLILFPTGRLAASAKTVKARLDLNAG